MPNTFLKNHVNFKFALAYILRILIVVPVSSGNFGSVLDFQEINAYVRFVSGNTSGSNA